MHATQQEREIIYLYLDKTTTKKQQLSVEHKTLTTHTQVNKNNETFIIIATQRQSSPRSELERILYGTGGFAFALIDI